MNLTDLKKKPIEELVEIANSVGVENSDGLLKQELIFEMLKQTSARNGQIYGQGVIEILPDGFGFLRSPSYNYLPGPDDIYVSPAQIRKFGLRNGDTVAGEIRPPKDNEKYFALLKVEEVNFEPASRMRTLFENLTPLFPEERLQLENKPNAYETRVMDLLALSVKGREHSLSLLRRQVKRCSLRVSQTLSRLIILKFFFLSSFLSMRDLRKLLICSVLLMQRLSVQLSTNLLTDTYKSLKWFLIKRKDLWSIRKTLLSFLTP